VLAAPVVRRFSANSLIAVTGMALIGLLHHAGPRWPRHPCERDTVAANGPVAGKPIRVGWLVEPGFGPLTEAKLPFCGCKPWRHARVVRSAGMLALGFGCNTIAVEAMHFFGKCSLGNPRRRSARLQAGASRLWADPANKLLLPPE